MRTRTHHPFIIAVDIDETIIRSFDVLLAHLNSKHQTTHRREHLTQHDWERIPDISWSLEEIDCGWDELYRNNEPLNHEQHLLIGARDGLEKLAQAGAKIIAITGRGKRAHKSTQHLLSTLFPGIFSWVFYVDYRHTDITTKGELARQHHVKVAIDDNPAFLRQLHDEGIDTYGINTPWNQWADREIGHTKFFDHWGELVDDICARYHLELSRAKKSHAVILPETSHEITLFPQERSLVNTEQEEHHLTVIEPHSHDLTITTSHPLVDISHEWRDIDLYHPQAPRETQGDQTPTDPIPKAKITRKTTRPSRSKKQSTEQIPLA